jgi:hypothetical protein
VLLIGTALSYLVHLQFKFGHMNLVHKYILLVPTMLKIWFKVDLILVLGEEKNGSNKIMIYFGDQIIFSLKDFQKFQN